MDFSEEGKTIEIKLERIHHNICLSVKNIGLALPNTMQSQLFDSMVSLREGKQASTHLGLGLFIVRLITEFHHGTAIAENSSDNQGVIIRINIPFIN